MESNDKKPKKRQWKKTRYYIDNELLGLLGKTLKPHGIAIYNVLAKHANSKTQRCFPRYETIMEQSGVGKRNTVAKYLEILEKRGVIEVERSKGRVHNNYRLLDVECWDINGIQIDTVMKKNSSIQKENEQYLKDDTNSICKAPNDIAKDTQSHTTKSDKGISDNISHCSSSFDNEDGASHRYKCKTCKDKKIIVDENRNVAVYCSNCSNN